MRDKKLNDKKINFVKNEPQVEIYDEIKETNIDADKEIQKPQYMIPTTVYIPEKPISRIPSKLSNKKEKIR
jgi:hypothetical protein